MLDRSVCARIELLVDEGLIGLAMASLAFANSKDPGADPADAENFDAATAVFSEALHGIRETLEK